MTMVTLPNTPGRIQRRYEALMDIPTYEERLRYLAAPHPVGDETFASLRKLNQDFYHSSEWRNVRDRVITRDWGCDLGLRDRPILGTPIVHHMVELTPDDFLQHSVFLLNPDYLITVSRQTHDLIHYGFARFSAPPSVIERVPFDTCPWKKVSA